MAKLFIGAIKLTALIALAGLYLVVRLAASLVVLVMAVLILMGEQPLAEFGEPMVAPPEMYTFGGGYEPPTDWELENDPVAYAAASSPVEVLVVELAPDNQAKLMALSIRELKAMAKERKLPGYSRMKKAELAAALA